jgi:DNA-binding GntR family transcriptional regulator
MPTSPKSGAHPRHAQLAASIVDLALANRWPAGQHLTESDLASRLNVSRTPVRAALRLLASIDAIEARPNRGYVLTRTGPALAATVVEPRPDTEDALHAAIIQDRLAGRLSTSEAQVELARRYAVGLPAVQRVLRRMEQEGLVSYDGWRWTFEPTLETVPSRRASYELRLMLEPPALLLPGFALDEFTARLLLDQHAAMLEGSFGMARDPRQVYELDARFHETLALFSGNPFVVNAVRQQNALRRLLEMGSYGDQQRVTAWCQEHMEILSALLRGAPQHASTLMRQHLERARRNSIPSNSDED